MPRPSHDASPLIPGPRTWLTLALVAFAALASLRVIQDPDYFTHLALGRAFLEAGTPRIREPFLAQPAGTEPPLLAAPGSAGPPGWPFQLALFALRSCCGDEGISIAIAAAAAAIAALLLALLPGRDVSATRIGLATTLTAAAIMVARFRFSPRAELPCFVLLALALVATSRWRARGGAGWFWGAAAAVGAWATLHPSWTMGAVAVGGALVLGRPLAWWRDLLAARRWVLVPGLAALALAAWAALRFAIAVTGELRGGVFAAVTEMRPAWEFDELFVPYLSLSAAALLLGWGAREGRWGRLLVWGFAFGVGLVVVRNVAFSALTMMAPALEGLAGTRPWREEPSTDRAAPWAAALALAAFAVIAVRDRDPPWGLGVDWPMFPRDAAAFVKERGLPGPVFNSWDFGGYADFAWGGSPRTFLDGRLGTGAIVADHDAITEATDPDRVLIERGFRTLLIKPLYQNSGNLVPIVPRLLADPRWSLVRASDALVFVRAPAPAGVERLDGRQGWLAVARQAAHFARNARAAVAAPYVRAIALSNAGRTEEAGAAWREAVRDNPALERRFSGR